MKLVEEYLAEAVSTAERCIEALEVLEVRSGVLSSIRVLLNDARNLDINLESKIALINNALDQINKALFRAIENEIGLDAEDEKLPISRVDLAEALLNLVEPADGRQK